ncbi:hypothetical protein TNCV_4358531 [Trichonephila clavipes]|nr:hypothetical protein TNCV_4358531 [Trichonephila clavipes]
MTPELDPQTRNEILRVLKDSSSNSILNKAFKNQKRAFSYGLLSELRKEIKFIRQLIAPGTKCRGKEVIGKKEKKKLKRQIAIENTLPQRTLAKKLQVLQSTICRQIKKIGYKK